MAAATEVVTEDGKEGEQEEDGKEDTVEVTEDGKEETREDGRMLETSVDPFLFREFMALAKTPRRTQVFVYIYIVAVNRTPFSGGNKPSCSYREPVFLLRSSFGPMSKLPMTIR